RVMGGLRKFMPITALTFMVAWLAISGIVPFAGFWSKDEILAATWVGGAAVTALLTAFYMTRQVWMVFYGDERWHEKLHHDPHESPKLMTIPLVALGVLSFAGGAINLPKEGLKNLTEWLHAAVPVQPLEVHSFGQGFMLSTIAV